MFDTRIEILEYTEERDEYNDLTKSLRHVAVCYAQRTENETIYTIRWQPGLRPDMVVRDEGYLRKITSIHEEGRRWRLHLKCRKSDADDRS